MNPRRNCWKVRLPRKNHKTERPPKIIQKNSLILAFLWLGLSLLQALEAPSKKLLKEQYILLHTDPQGTRLYMPKDNDKDRLQLSVTDSVVEITYTSPKSYSDKRFTELADRHGAGGLWHETPISPDKKIHRFYPGLEQQWFLKGFQNKKGWMGSGLHNNQFFLVFRSSSPMKKTEFDGPLQIKPGFVRSLKRKGSWIPTTCGPQSKSAVCYLHDLDHELKIQWDGRDTTRFTLTTKPSNDIREIQAVMEQLTRDKIPEYSKELPALARSEGQSILYRIVQAEPEMFTWPSHQLQSLEDGYLASDDYFLLFQKQGTNWPYLPLIHLKNDKLDLQVRLHFDGRYEMVARTK